MRLLATADLHYNHPRSKAVAEELIGQVNALSYDVLLLVGDTAIPDGDSLERCLSLFTFAGPKLFVPGNHELWTHAPDSYAILAEDLPRRVAALGWHFLPGRPFTLGDVAVVGSLGWYDYAYANPQLGIPRRFYAHKISPGAAAHLDEFRHLLADAHDVAPAAMEVHARWNDGRFVRLHRSDEAFLDEQLDQLERDLNVCRGNRIVAAVHHVPFRELLPPPSRPQLEFAKAYLGSPRIGELLLRHPDVSHVLCGHSHFAAEAQLGGRLRAVNIGSGYRQKTHVVLTL